MVFQIYSIGYLDLKNIGIDTKIIVIGALSAVLLPKNVFFGGHFEFMHSFFIFTMKKYVMVFQICSIGYIDLKNIGIDTKIMVIGALSAVILPKNGFFCGHFECMH